MRNTPLPILKLMLFVMFILMTLIIILFCTFFCSECGCDRQPDLKGRAVLYWTPVWGEDPISLLTKRDVYYCSPDCLITSNRCDLRIADILIFHSFDISFFDRPVKRSNQKWVYFNRESPQNAHLWERILFYLFDHKFDSLMSYHSESAFHAPYGRVTKRSEQTTRLMVSLKRKKVAWFVSNCDTVSRREEIVNQLQQYIPVDIYGKCGSLMCGRNNDSCDQMMERDYAFYLAFENSICDEYVTEKLFRTLKYNVVPVVLGDSKFYSNALPAKSVIDASEFGSIPLLAQYLHRVSTNQTLYNSFFDWKTNYQSDVIDAGNLFCSPCRISFQTKPKQKSLYDWWFDDAHCSSRDNT